MQLPSLYLLALWLHVLSACLWVGGLWFFVLALVPPLRRDLPMIERVRLIKAVGRRFRVIGWSCLSLLLISGYTILIFRGITWSQLFSTDFWSGTFGKVLAVKLIVFASIIVCSLLHDFVLGPRATVALQQEPNSPKAQKLRRWTGLLGRANGVLSLVVIVLAIMLVRGWAW